MRLMALDYGARTVGVAITDPVFLTAAPLEVIRRKKENHLRPTLARIGELVQEYGVELIVCGLPLNMDDTAGERAKLSGLFASEVERRTGVRCVLQDERLSSFEAEEELREWGASFRETKEAVDMYAAAVILRDYIEQHRKELEEQA